MTTVPIPSGRSGDEERALSTLDYWSPVRPLRLIGTGVALTAIDFVDDGAGIRSRNHAAAAGPVLREAARQLDAYFRGRLLRFELPLEPGGTPFQQAVWSALQEIPHGEIVTYGELARQIGRPRAVRAVGAANSRNPIAIVIPCHRVVGHDGRLTGYGGGLDVKAALLALEAARGRNPTARPPITRDEPPRSAGPAGQVHHRAQSRFQEVAIVGPKRDVAELPASSGGLVVEMEVSALDGEDPGGRG